MNLEYVPLLQLQRDLYQMPRGMDRFRNYLRTMINDTGDGLDLPPLAIMNPMAKDHVPALLDTYLEMDADTQAAEVVEQLSSELPSLEVDCKIGLVLADDKMGGWTNRYSTEYSTFSNWHNAMKSGWFSGILWSSDPPTLRSAIEAALIPVYRSVHVQENGFAQSLCELMAQEGYAMAKAGCEHPALDDEDLEYTREVLKPFLEARDVRTIIECLYGDVAGQTLGFTPRGLSADAGLALALSDARAIHCT